MTTIERNSRIMDAMRSAGIDGGRIEPRGAKPRIHFVCGDDARGTLNRIVDATKAAGLALRYVCVSPNGPSHVDIAQD